MNKNVIARLAAGVLAAGLLLGAGAGAAVADDGPLVQSTIKNGVSVGNLLDVGQNYTVNGTHTKTGTKVNGPAGVTTNISNGVDVNANVALDLAASILASVG
ncbi:hypothetical protein AB0J38_14090 [Streptomyces sp. NPDC050095]|uniref:hypothetical protein n=1 Tax=unclassified Streptomyces TaxID=2593676 RepID=UPI003428D2E0